jgi:ATP adenylyltransferase/5',5'''-P-1,P-4-tetraphosphate phosphorylase II
VVVEEAHLFRKMAGTGAHEVIIETPSHNTAMALMPYEQVEKVLIAYQERYNALKKNQQYKFITIFKNHGWASGTSLVHPHSQLVATPIVATFYRQEFEIAHEYYVDVFTAICSPVSWRGKKELLPRPSSSLSFILTLHAHPTRPGLFPKATVLPLAYFRICTLPS